MKKFIHILIIFVAFMIIGETVWGGPAENAKKLKKTKSCVKCDLSGIKLMADQLTGANLTGANLTGATLMMVNLSKANLSNANLSEAKLQMTDLSGANLTGANLTETDAQGSNFSKANLVKANLTESNINASDFSNADISNAIMIDVKWSGIKGIDTMIVANVEAGDGAEDCGRCPRPLVIKINQNNTAHLKKKEDEKSEQEKKIKLAAKEKKNKRKKGVIPLGRGFTKCLQPHPRGEGGVDHKGCNLSLENSRFPSHILGPGRNWSGHRFDEANLSGRDLTDSIFKGSSLIKADLSDTTLDNANFENANLMGADFTDADLTDANLTGAVLTGAKFSGADLTGLILGDADIKNVKDLETYIANNSQATNNTKVNSVEKIKISRRLAKRIDEYTALYKEIKKSLDSIKNCCEYDPSVLDDKQFAKLKKRMNENSRSLLVTYKGTLENGERLLDPSTKESEIQNIAKYEKKTFNDKLKHIVRLELVSKFSYAKQRAEEIFYKAIENKLARTKRNAEYEARKKAKRDRIALIANTLLYKKMTDSFREGFLTNPINVMHMMKFKMLGKSDGEIAELWETAINNYNSCLSDEIGKRFGTTEVLKKMATEIGTHELELVSLTVKCETGAAQALIRASQRQ
jgi:uncharacterized protein YjbI with pentapeptide repeats